MATVRKSPALNLTLHPDAREALDRLAEEDAATFGRAPNLSATVAALVAAETARRAKRAKKEQKG